MGKLLRIFALLCVLLTLFSGCGKAAEAKKNENIRISNLKTASMSLSQEEKEYMDAVCAALETAQIKRIGDGSAIICAKNASENDLDVYFYVCGFDKDGALVSSSWGELKKWEKGQELRTEMMSTLSSDVETFTVIGEYRYNDYWYMTDPIPVPAEIETGDSEVTLQYADNLPAVVRLEQSWGNPVGYTLLDFKLEKAEYNDHGYDLTILIRKESGEDNGGDSIPVCILDKDGHVHYTYAEYVELNRGETIRLKTSISLYEPGEYYLELR